MTIILTGLEMNREANNTFFFARKKTTIMQPTDMSKAHSWGHLCQCSGNIIPLRNDSLSLEGYDSLTRMLIAFKS